MARSQRFSAVHPLIHCAPPLALTLLNGRDLVGIGIGNLNCEFLLDGHDYLYCIERVEAEVGGEC